MTNKARDVDNASCWLFSYVTKKYKHLKIPRVCDVLPGRIDSKEYIDEFEEG